MNVIEINNLTKDFGNNKGIFDLSFSLKQGEVVGFLGSNGAGKTTTIRHLMGFIKADNGSAKILNMDCFKNAYSVQEKIGYLPGEIAFMDNMTGAEFIHFMADMKNITDLQYARELIAYFDIDTKIKIKKMSKGMKQKIGLIIAFMQDTPILILDEPTTGLDPLMQTKFVDLIKKEKAKGKTILMSSHIFEEIENTCERIVMIKDGRLVADENINAMRNKMNKHYEISFSNMEDAIHFQKLYSSNSYRKNNVVYLLSNQNINHLIRELSKFNIEDINARYQTLEEVFMKYYGGSEK
ncbi:ABC transporter ATP-binding protein [Holdemanella sp.]|uniref:ABC transporter ATP-binding protein n=1 Tax=Holdemanella sp. TaxID=1971762 RepID=UPI002E79F13A|nr:ABC transporter ATP-binding protein [Holdemanella sp.]MEE0466627.1 ABC transporter ATP-binding protein [Holdemanella sp.]